MRSALSPVDASLESDSDPPPEGIVETMDLVGSLVNAAVIGIVGLLVAWYTKGRFESLDRRMDRMERSQDGLRSDLAQLRESNDRAHEALRSETTQLREGNDLAHEALRSEMGQLREGNDLAHAGIRGDLTLVALAVGARPKAGNA